MLRKELRKKEDDGSLDKSWPFSWFHVWLCLDHLSLNASHFIVLEFCHSDYWLRHKERERNSVLATLRCKKESLGKQESQLAPWHSNAGH